MGIPDYQALMLPVLRYAASGAQQVPKLAEMIADDFGLSAEARAELLPSGKQRVLHNRIHWAKFYLSKAGLLESPARGVFVASEAGKQLLESKPERLDNETLMRIPQFKAFYNGAATASSGENADVSLAPTLPQAGEETPEEQIEAAHQALQAALQSELLERVRQNSPDFFERLILEVLVAMGYGGSQANAARKLGRTGDGGVDGVIDEDRLGLSQIYVQAKRYGEGHSVGRPEVQGFVGSLVGLGASRGVFFTTSTFSRGAVEYAANLRQRVILIDGAGLTSLMIEYGVGTREYRTLKVQRLDEDFFSGEV